MKLLIINGPNLNMLGLREPDIYGRQNYAALVRFCEDTCREADISCKVFQSNHEGALVDEIQAAYGVFDGIVINPAAYTHTSVAILDALKAVALPAVEVHLSDVSSREAFRQVSYAGMACVQTYAGLGFAGYLRAIDWLLENITPRETYAGPLSEIADGERPRVARFERVPGAPEAPLPRRATAGSAGYDFFAPAEISLAPGESVTVDTGVRCRMDSRYVLLLFPRSSLGFRYRLALDNTVGVIDADYYFADNLGHIRIRMTNGGGKPLCIPAGRLLTAYIRKHERKGKENGGRKENRCCDPGL